MDGKSVVLLLFSVLWLCFSSLSFGGLRSLPENSSVVLQGTCEKLSCIIRLDDCQHPLIVVLVRSTHICIVLLSDGRF